nr:WxL domain-containing protein [Vagococcus zengguangii]
MLSLATLGVLASQKVVNAEELKTYQSNGSVKFIPNLDPTDPVDPEKPDPENPVKPIDPTDPEGPNPGTQGPLSIDYASSLDFGTNRISNKDQIYYARAQSYEGDQQDTPNFVQISDHRGTNSGWTLKVKQEGEFTATSETLNNVLTGAQITFKEPKVNSNAKNVEEPIPSEIITLKVGEESLVTSAKAGTGAGTWATYWGNVETVEEHLESGETKMVNVTKAVKLSVPGATPKDAVTYQTKLVWSLTDTPGQ